MPYGSKQCRIDGLNERKKWRRCAPSSEWHTSPTAAPLRYQPEPLRATQLLILRAQLVPNLLQAPLLL